MPPFVGLTGGIGAGKSTALAALERLGAQTISTDAVVHALYETDEVRDAVVARFGPEVAPEGVVDRGLLAQRAFATDADREFLEQLLWPLVGARVWEWRERVAEMDPAPPAGIVETPLLFEAGMGGLYDATIAIVTDEAVRAERAAARGHRAVDERTARQLSQQEKAERATYVVINDGSVEQLQGKLSSILDMLNT